MKKRNWNDLSRKLVDRYDLTYTLSGMSEILGLYALSFFGEGVLETTMFPNPFPIVTSGISYNLTVGNGVSYDPEGSFTEISTGPSLLPLVASDVVHPRKDLIVIRYKEIGDSLVPKPSDPLTSIYLNLLDGFELAIVEGTPAAIPTYPSKGIHDVILAGLTVPANATLGNQCAVDLSIRENGRPNTVVFPDIVQEQLTGVVNGVNTIFSTSKKPIDGTLIIWIDGSRRSYLQVSDTEFNLGALELGQSANCFYIFENSSSTNPLAMTQEIPIGATDGVNQVFALAGRTANKNSTFLFLDGAIVPFSEWSLTQGPAGDTVKFELIETPQRGQDIYLAYFTNPKVEAPVGGGGGSGDGSLVVYGSISTPIIVTDIAGLVVPTDVRQLQFIKGPVGTGAVEVSASPPIANGSKVGQELKLSGTEDEVTGDYPIFNEVPGLRINGSWKATNKGSLTMIWSGIDWFEDSRR